MSSFFELDSYRDILKSEFESRQLKNPRYSLRAFARDMGSDPSHMTRIFNGTKGLSRISAARLVKCLEFNNQKKRYFLNLVQIDQGKDPKRIRAAKEENEYLKQVMKHRILDADSFELISDWRHYAILMSLIITDGNLNIQRISNCLEVNTRDIEVCLARLVKLGSIEKLSATKYKILDKHLRMENQTVPTQAIRSFHAGLIGKALDSIEGQTPDERELASAVLTFDLSQLSEAKNYIRDFEASFRERFAHSKIPNSAYALSVQFFKVAEKGELE